MKMEARRNTRQSAATEAQHTAVFGNYVILRRLLSNFRPDQLYYLRLINKLWNEVSSYVLRTSGTKYNLRSSERLRRFVIRMDQRSHTRLPASRFVIGLWAASTDILNEFAEKYGDQVEKLSINCSRPLRDYFNLYDDGTMTQSQLFASQQIGPKILNLLQKTVNLRELKVKSDFEVAVSIDVGTRISLKRLNKISVKYLDPSNDSTPAVEDILTKLVRDNPHLPTVEIHLFPGLAGYNGFLLRGLHSLFQKSKYFPIMGNTKVSLRTIFTTNDISEIKNLVHCTLQKLSFSLSNPQGRNPGALSQNLSQLLLHQSGSLEELRITTLDEPLGSRIRIPRLQHLKMLGISFSEDLPNVMPQIHSFDLGNFPALNSLELGFYREHYGLFKNVVLPTVKIFIITILESPPGTERTEWNKIFPNLSFLDLHDRTWFQVVLKYVLLEFTKLESLRIRVCNLGTDEGIRDILTGESVIDLQKYGLLNEATPRIQHLEEQNINQINEGQEVEPQNLPSLQNLTGLKSLTISCFRLQEVIAVVYMVGAGKVNGLKKLRMKFGGRIPKAYHGFLDARLEEYIYNTHL